MTVVIAACAALAVVLWPVVRDNGGPARDRADGDRSRSRVAKQRGFGRGCGAARPPPPAVHEVADALVLVALALRAGLPVVASLEHAASTASGPVVRDLSAVAAALRWGRPTGVAWGYADPVWAPAALALQMAESTGAGPADLVDAAAQRLREEQERDRERRAARAGVLLVLPLGFGFLPAFACTAVIPLVAVLADGVLGAS